MAQKKYPSYKQSGVKWIGEIPNHWKVKRLKIAIDYTINGIWGEEPLNDGDDLLCVRVADFNMDKLGISTQKATYRSMKGSQIRDRLLLPDDILIEKSGGGENQSVGRAVSVSIKEQAVCSNFIGRIVPNRKVVFPRFLVYLLYNIYNHGINKRSINQTTGIQNLDLERYLSEIVIFPTEKEQHAIASYLDKKTGLIDDTIRKKERLIELFQEERTAIINQAVTRGLNPTVKMKDSGFEWLGQIPEHWKIKRLKHFSLIKYGLGQPPQTKVDGLPLIRATNVYRGTIDENNLVFVDPDDIPWERDPVLKAGDIIVVRSGAYTADSAIIPNKFEGAITGYDMVVRVSDADKEFIAVSLLSGYVLYGQLYQHRLRAAQPHLNREELGETFFALPPLEEQQMIVNIIRQEHEKIDKAVNLTKKEIQLLQEYRTALINEVITGKRCVIDNPETLSAA